MVLFTALVPVSFFFLSLSFYLFILLVLIRLQIHAVLALIKVRRGLLRCPLGSPYSSVGNSCMHEALAC